MGRGIGYYRVKPDLVQFAAAAKGCRIKTLRVENCDVLIVGAGAAGLAAGRALAEAGKHAVIVEARDRIGGRILTAHATGPSGAVPVAMELGAEFVHGLPASTWRLLHEAKLATYELEGAQWCFDDGLLHPCGEEQGNSFEVLQQMSRWLASQPAGTDATFAEYLSLAGITGSTAERAGAYVEGFNAADRRIVGVAALARQQQAENSIQADRIFHIRAGYSALVKFLGARFLQAGGSIHMQYPVRHIRWAAGEVTASGFAVGGEEFKLRATQAVITLPLGVLQSGLVEFAPMPQQIALQIGKMAMGCALRITLLFDTRFWEMDTQRHLSFLFARRGALPTWWTSQPDATPLITAWVGGPKAIALANDLTPRGHREASRDASRGALRDEALRELAQMFGLSAAHLQRQLVAWHAHDWRADPYSQGAYSYAPSGALLASLRMAEPVARTLYFAGEHTDTEGHWGTVHAALNSGLRAADQVLAKQ
jgi:monoamine oxidase